jgi:hypothetical protein
LCSFGVCLTQEDDALLSEFKSSGSYRIDRLSAADALGSLNSTRRACPPLKLAADSENSVPTMWKRCVTSIRCCASSKGSLTSSR